MSQYRYSLLLLKAITEVQTLSKRTLNMIYICNLFADINENAVTITGDSTAFFDLRVSSNPLEMEERIIFSIGTQVYKALIFYMYDELNNFIQLEVVEGKKLRFTRNNFQQIFHQDIEVPGLCINGSVILFLFVSV